MSRRIGGMKMESGNRRRTRIQVGSVRAGSVWESRMNKNEHQVKGKNVVEVITLSKSDLVGQDTKSKSDECISSDSVERRDSIMSSSSSSSSSSSKSKRHAASASPSMGLNRTRSLAKIKMITNSSPLIRKTKSEPNNNRQVVVVEEEEEEEDCTRRSEPSSSSSSTQPQPQPQPQPNVCSSPMKSASAIEFNPLGIQSGLHEASSPNPDHHPDPHFNLNHASGDGDKKELVGGHGSEIEVANTIGENTSSHNIIKEIKVTSLVSKPQLIKRPSSIVTSNGIRKSFPTLKKPTPTPSQAFNNSTKWKKSTQQSSNSEVCRTPECHGRFQSVVDLVMWKDVSRSALVFGIGSFFIISSSYAKDVNISLISGVSYVGLVYLAVTFLYRSIMCRGMIEEGDSPVVGEDEAVWMLKLILPYINELLSNMRHLFSGDPALTIKMALILFVLAICGNSITIWKVIQLGFFGVFVIPKLCSSYSTHMIAYGKFWVQRMDDAWRSCSHKKFVAFGILSLVWNCCSIVGRAWTAFMLLVVVRYYQQSLRDACNSAHVEVEVEDGLTQQVQVAHLKKEKKSF